MVGSCILMSSLFSDSSAGRTKRYYFQKRKNSLSNTQCSTHLSILTQFNFFDVWHRHKDSLTRRQVSNTQTECVCLRNRSKHWIQKKKDSNLLSHFHSVSALPRCDGIVVLVLGSLLLFDHSLKTLTVNLYQVNENEKCLWMCLNMTMCEWRRWW